VSFGGPAGQIALLERELLQRRQWIRADDFRDGLAVAALLPGPEALKLVIFCGWRMHGLAGGVFAGLAFLGPSVLLLLALSFGYVRYGAVPAVAAALQGLAAVVVALIAHALWRLLPRFLAQRWLIGLALAAGVLFVALGVSFGWIVLGALLVGVLRARLLAPVGAAAQEPLFGRLHRLAGRSVTSTIAGLGTGLLLWLLLAGALWAAGGSSDQTPLRVLGELTRVSLVAFGGAYPAVAFANAEFVERLGWLTAEQAAVGLALAETTPGPLVIVLQFYGFMAAYNLPQPFSAETAAVLGSVAASTAIFLPSFVLMLMVAPFIDVLRRDPRIFAAMAAVTAVILVAIADLGWRFAVAVLWRGGAIDLYGVAIALLALVLLTVRRIEAHWVIALGALLGFARTL